MKNFVKGLVSLVVFAGVSLAFEFPFAKLKTTPETEMTKVRNVTNITLSAGTVVVFSTGMSAGFDDSYIGVDVNTATVIYDKLFAGVLAESVESGDYAYVYVRGYCPAINVGTIAVNDPIGPSSVNGVGDVSSTVGKVWGYALDTVVSTGTAKAWLLR